MSNELDLTAKLNTVLGFDPAKGGNSSADVFKEALREVQEERAAANKAKAIELIKKAIECRKKFDEVEKQFNSQKKKFNKELGSLLKNIEAMAKGSETPEADEEPTEN